MNDQQSYEELNDEQLNDLPLPNMEQSWEMMKQLLDKDDDDDAIIPPFLLKGCIGWGIGSLLLLIALGWFLLHSSSTSHSPLKQIKTNEIEKPLNNTHQAGQSNSAKRTEDSNYYTVNPGVETKKTDQTSRTSFKTKSLLVKDKMSGPIASRKRQSADKQKHQAEIIITKTEKKQNYQHNIQHKAATDKQIVVMEQENSREPMHRYIQITLQHLQKQDVKLLPIHLAVQKNVSGNSNVKPPQKTINHFYFGAGIALQQQIPFNGQKATPYSYYGRQVSLADYIPSVYVRLYREKKWYLQGEFRYGGPQYPKQLNYSTVAKYDTFTTITTTRSLQLKKTYYHQFPISFNYYVLPHLSIGTGILYSRFHGALSEELLKQKNNQTGTETILSKKIIEIPAGTDSFFTHTQLQALFQTEYQYKRFTVGLRYTKGLQPYIRYTEPNGNQKKETNQTLQAFVRFELWNNKDRKNNE